MHLAPIKIPPWSCGSACAVTLIDRSRSPKSVQTWYHKWLHDAKRKENKTARLCVGRGQRKNRQGKLKHPVHSARTLVKNVVWTNWSVSIRYASLRTNKWILRLRINKWIGQFCRRTCFMFLQNFYMCISDTPKNRYCAQTVDAGTLWRWVVPRNLSFLYPK